MNESALRALRVAVVVMGVLIVFGVIGLVGAVAYRAAGRSSVAPGASSVPVGVVPGMALPDLVLDEPAGTHVLSASGGGERVVLVLQGGGPDRAVVVDARTGQVLQRIRLAR